MFSCLKFLHEFGDNEKVILLSFNSQLAEFILIGGSERNLL